VYEVASEFTNITIPQSIGSLGETVQKGIFHARETPAVKVVDCPEQQPDFLV
jgi:hypothetical protein